MKRFVFNLQSVLTLREFRKNEAALALQDATRRRRELEEQLAFMHRSTEQMEQDLLRCLTPVGRASEIIVRQNALAYQRGKARELLDALNLALKEEEQRRDLILQAQREEETLVRLRKQQLERSRQEAEREDDQAAQEFVNARFATQEN